MNENETVLEAEFRLLTNQIESEFAKAEEAFDWLPYFTTEEVDTLPVLREALMAAGYME